MSTGGWAPALRIAWRTARHHRGRTALVAVLVALPVLVGGFVAVVARTAQLPDEERVRRFMGAAEAYVQIWGCGPIPGIAYADGRPSGLAAPCEEAPGVDIRTRLPPGSMVAASDSAFAPFTRVHHGERSVRMSLQEQPDIASPLREGMVRLRSGRFPTTTGEVMATTRALEDLRASVGDRVTVDQGSTAVIVGEYVDPDSLGWATMIGPPGWTGLAPTDVDQGPGTVGAAFLVDLPEGTDILAVQRRLLKEGIIFAPREHVLDPPQDQRLEYGGNQVNVEAVALIALAVGFGLLEVVLLAGTAFAVTARRQVRDLGLIAAAGGEARHLRRIVLAQGVVIGLIGAAFAIPLAVTAVFFARPWLEMANDALMGPLDVRPLELIALVVLGVLAGLAAALVPAFTTARLPVLDALNRRFKATSLRARWPRIGIAMLAVGIAVSAAGAWLWRDAQLDHRDRLERFNEAQRQQEPSGLRPGIPGGDGGVVGAYSVDPGFYPGPPSNTAFLGLMLLGFALAAFGLAVNAPALVATVARVGRWLPLSARLALRDAGRHRHRTGPAVAAIMAAVAGSVALSFYVLSQDTMMDRDYDWGLRYGQVRVSYGWAEGQDGSDGDEFIAAVEHASNSLPARRVVPIHVAGLPGTELLPDGSVHAACWEVEPRACQGTSPVGVGGSAELVGVGGSAELALSGNVPAEAMRVLRSGQAVVADRSYIKNGEVTLELWDGENAGPRTLTLSAVEVLMSEAYSLPAVWISPETAADLGFTATLSSVVIDTTRAPTRDEEDQAVEALENELGPDMAYLWVERGYQSEVSVVFLVLVGGSAFVTLVGTAIAVALAGAESRADHATLLAVGAEPRRRRVLAMGQAGTVSVLGVGLGVILGSIVGASVLGGHEDLPFVVPWMTLAEIAIGIPLLGVLIAGLFTRSRLPLERRIM